MRRGANRTGQAAAALALVVIPLTLHVVPVGAAGTADVRLSTNASTSTSLGLSILANANVVGTGPPVTGSVTFRVFGPADTTCSSALFTSTAAVAANLATSARFTPAHAGTYRWQSTYSGDATYAASGPTPCADPGAAVTVAKATTVLGAATGPSTPTTVHGSANLTGGSHPTGTITFVLTGPDDMFCGGTPAFTSTVAVNGTGTYDSGAFSPTRSGAYTWRALYGGDTDNLGTSFTPCLNPAASQTVTVAPAKATQKVPYSVWSQAAATPLDGIGAWVDTVNDPAAAGGQLAPAYLYGHSFRFAGSTASGVVGLATGAAAKSAVLSVVGPDGVAHNAGIGFNWSPGHLYYLFVYNVAPGVWSAWVHDYSSVDWTPIGSLTLPAAWGKLSSVSTTTAAWYGAPATQCAAYPRADLVFSPPVGYVGSTATVANLAGTATTTGDCPASTSVDFGVWAGYHLGT